MSRKPQQELPFVIEAVAGRAAVRAIAKNADGYHKIDIDLIKIRPGFNARVKPEDLDEELWDMVLGIHDLGMAVYANNGPADPILGDILPDGYFYQTDGERRIRAIRALIKEGYSTYPNGTSLSEVRILLNPAGTTELERKIKVVSTQNNLPLSVLQKAVHYQRIVTEEGLTHSELAGKVGCSRQTINNYIKLLSIPLDIQENVDQGKMTLSDALAADRESRKDKGAGVNWDDDDPGKPKPERKEEKLAGDEDDFKDTDNSITGAGSMGGVKETGSGAVSMPKDSIYMTQQCKALFKQVLHEAEDIRTKHIVNGTVEEVNAANEIVVDELCKRFHMTLR